MLERGGLLCISTPNKQLSPIIKPTIWHHYHEFTPKEFYNLLLEYFDEVEPFCQRFVNSILHMVTVHLHMVTVQTLFIGSRILEKQKRIKIFARKFLHYFSQNNAKIKIPEKRKDFLKLKFGVHAFSKSLFKNPLYLIAVAKKKNR